MSIRLHSFLSVLFTLGVLYPPTVFGALVNVTVDDQNLDPVTEESISYEGPWDRQPGCLECTAKPDPLRAYDGTWHDASFDVNSSSQLIVPNATFSFIGTAIYVFGMVDNSYGIELVFYLDDKPSGSYTRPPSTDQAFTFSQTYFWAEGLPHTTHVLKMQNGRPETAQQSVVLFDYLVYTRDDGDNESSAAPSSDPAASSSLLASTTARSSALSPPSSSAAMVPSEQSTKPSTVPVTPSSTLSSTSSPTPSSTNQSSSPSTVMPTNPSTILVTAPSSTPFTVPSATLALSVTGNRTGMSGTTRAIVIAVAIVVFGLILGLLVLLYRAHRNHQERRAGAAGVVPGFAYSSAIGSDGNAPQMLPYPYAPSYYSVSPAPFMVSNTDQLITRPSYKARNTAVSAQSSPEVQREEQTSDERERSSVSDSVSNVVSVRRPGGSIAAETAPPTYQSEVGIVL
ncbi:hypothetical protein PsYK624_054210 [Phanerochaete sordida]|uniref:Transmembrane protein n=1 Tax=Phanerochaete sordida TaxID=48140 RepID=A0A9P3LCX6_9APHY|nr:hypothetical protein PsYK624_054210 [Phanerochaete sordida]